MAAPDPETVSGILQWRAEQLARPLEVEDRSEMLGTVGLTVGGNRYAVEFQHVVAVEPLGKVTPVPGTPEMWAGLANIRGTMRPVLDLRAYLGVGVEPPRAARTIVVVSAAGLCVGLLCDEASDVGWIRRHDIAAPPSGGRTSRAVLRGVTPDMVGVLNLEALLSDPALVVDDDGA